MLVLVVVYKPSRGSLRTLALSGDSSLSAQDFIFKVYVELRCVKSKRKGGIGGDKAKKNKGYAL